MKGAITITILFEADALNRDEKAGNVLSIKKLARGWGDTYSFISRPAIRHYLWVTLHRTNSQRWEEGTNRQKREEKKNRQRWEEAPVKRVEGNIIQFAVENEEKAIQEYAELDIFGYMATVEGKALTRKSRIGITKAVSLEPWVGDMGFYANHDLVRRFIKKNPQESLQPNPYNCEEHKTLYKLSFTLDCQKVGRDQNDNLLIPEEERIGRITDVVNAIYNGLYYHTAGECPGIIPLFLVAGIVKIPIPIFHPFVDVDFYKENYRPKFKIRENLLKNGISNEWIIKDTKKLIFIEAREPEALSTEFINEHSYTNEWNQFINELFK